MRLRGQLVDAGRTEVAQERVEVHLAADRDVAREDRLAALEQADDRDAAADVDERRERVGPLGIVHLVGIRERERLDVEHDRPAARLRDDAGAVVDAILACAATSSTSSARLGRVGRRVDDLIVELDFAEVERDVLLGLPGNRFAQLRLAHRRQRQALDDDGVAGERGRDARAPQLERVEQAADGFADRGRLGGRAVLHAAFGQRGFAGGDERPAAAARAEHNGLDGARADVEANSWRTKGGTENIIAAGCRARLMPDRRGRVQFDRELFCGRLLAIRSPRKLP